MNWQSIWFCTDSDGGEKGIVEYSTITRKYKFKKYPKDLGPIAGHSCCNHQHLIYIVNGKHNNLLIFNTKTRQFIDTIKIPKIGVHSTSIMINQQLHKIGKERITKEDINKYLNKIRAKLNDDQYPEVDGLIFIYSGHGTSHKGEDYIVSSDLDGLFIGEIKKKFAASDCGILKKKPKLFYLDCCRGGGVIDEKKIEHIKGNKSVGDRHTSDLSDFYLHMATSQDYVAYCKGKDYGSHMIHALYLCLKEAYHKKKMDKYTIYDYKTKINKMVNTSKKGGQVPEIIDNLTYKVRIDPC